ncbi:MAG: hypothetical protein WCD18_04815 [Thermosynechococcaceae cyanobacterium]
MHLSASHLENAVHSGLNPVQAIQEHLKQQSSGCLEISSASVNWFVYFEYGQLIYITHSVDPVDRLDSHLKCLGRHIPTLTAEIRTQIRLSLDLLSDRNMHPRQDFHGIGFVGRRSNFNR